MEHLKTYEQLNKFYKSADKYLILNEEETLVIFKPEDWDALILFDVSILEHHIDIFLIDSHSSAQGSVKIHNKKLTAEKAARESGIPKKVMGIYKLVNLKDDMKLIRQYLSKGKIQFSQFASLIHFSAMAHDRLEAVEELIDLKVVEMQSGVRKSKKMNFG